MTDPDLNAKRVQYLQDRHAEALVEHGEAIVRAETKLHLLDLKLDKLILMVERHETILNEYTGARKILHWIVVAIGAVGGYLFGTRNHP